MTLPGLSCLCEGAAEAMQHPDHADREREHGAGREREGREEEERTKEQLGESEAELHFLLVIWICFLLTPSLTTSPFSPGAET